MVKVFEAHIWKSPKLAVWLETARGEMCCVFFVSIFSVQVNWTFKCMQQHSSNSFTDSLNLVKTHSLLSVHSLFSVFAEASRSDIQLFCLSSTWNLLKMNLTSSLLHNWTFSMLKVKPLVTLVFKLGPLTSSLVSYLKLTFDPVIMTSKQELELTLCVFSRNKNLFSCFTCELQLYFPTVLLIWLIFIVSSFHVFTLRMNNWPI